MSKRSKSEIAREITALGFLIGGIIALTMKFIDSNYFSILILMAITLWHRNEIERLKKRLEVLENE